MRRNTYTVPFVRTTGFNKIENMKIMSVDSYLPKSKILAAIQAAVTEWVIATDQGEKEWQVSCRDFNIGDLSMNLENADLIRILKKHDIWKLECLFDLDGDSATVSYDLVLVNYRKLKDALQ